MYFIRTESKSEEETKKENILKGDWQISKKKIKKEEERKRETETERKREDEKPEETQDERLKPSSPKRSRVAYFNTFRTLSILLFLYTFFFFSLS